MIKIGISHQDFPHDQFLYLAEITIAVVGIESWQKWLLPSFIVVFRPGSMFPGPQGHSNRIIISPGQGHIEKWFLSSDGIHMRVIVQE